MITVRKHYLFHLDGDFLGVGEDVVPVSLP